MFVAASTRCFPDLPLGRSLEKLADLEYTTSEIVIGNQPGDLSPALMANDFGAAVRLCLGCRPISPAAIFFDIPTDDPEYFEKFQTCAHLANALRVIPISLRCAVKGTPYNEEIERLRRLVEMGAQHGIIVSVVTQGDTMTESIDLIASLCRSVPHLAITLDPSWFIYKRKKGVDMEAVIPRVIHVRLRDTTEDKFQVQIGQGLLEYNKLVIQLGKIRYNRALCVDLAPLKDIDQESEMRKMRLLIESIL